MMRLVTGMHRSGTSLVTRVLQACGADLGDPATLWPGDRWNPDGYFEQADVVRVNRRLTQGAWGRLAYFRLPSDATVMRRARAEAGELRRLSAEYAERTVKETRFCLTLPAWREHGLAPDRVLLCLREPADVARSLGRRNRLPRALGLSLWRQHNERALRACADLRLHVVRYESLLAESSFEAEVGAALEFLGLDVGPGGVAGLHPRFVRPSSGTRSGPSPDYPRAVRELYDTLTDMHAKQPRRAGAV